MASYLITGASRGLGYEFVRQLSRNPNNTIIGLVRDKSSTEKKTKELHRSNIHIVQADMGDYSSLKSVIEQITPIVNGSLDYVFANAAYISYVSAYDTFGSLSDRPELLEEDLIKSFRINTVGNIHFFNLLLPLVLKSHVKKIITISSGFADEKLNAQYELDMAGAYCISKIAMNMAVAKFSAEYAKQGVLFLSLSPGVVDTGSEGHPQLTNNNTVTETQLSRAKYQGEQFGKYAPKWRGLIQPEESVAKMLRVVELASVEGGYGGDFLSHHGNKQWL